MLFYTFYSSNNPEKQKCNYSGIYYQSPILLFPHLDPSLPHHSFTIPSYGFHDVGDPALGGIAFCADTSFNKSTLVDGGMEFGQILFTRNRQREVLKGLHGCWNLPRQIFSLKHCSFCSLTDTVPLKYILLRLHKIWFMWYEHCLCSYTLQYSSRSDINWKWSFSETTWCMMIL